MRARRPSFAVPRLAQALALSALALAAAAPPASAGVLREPIDPRHQTALPFGARSHWLQPWRAYLETPPALRLRHAIGINLNVELEEIPATARLLARSGFRRARFEIGWDQMDFGHPDRLRNPGRLRAYLVPLRAEGIRPLILLNANHARPVPARALSVNLPLGARRGERRVLLDGPSARAVVPHRTGLDHPGGDRMADVIFTSVDASGRATLSRPLPRRLAAGRHPAATLRFAPFGPPRLADGRPNPRFEETLRGWLAYARAVAREARRTMGSRGFDLEIWNELSFGSDFLFQQRYYSPDRERGRGEVTKEILRRTVGHLRDPRNGVAGAGIADGFASESPFASGATSPRGLTALAKHPYRGLVRFPADSVFDGLSPLDARGRTDFTESAAPGGGLRRRDRFVPRYNALFPESALSAIQTETLIRDISPFTTGVYGTPHGRRTRPPGGAPPRTWITELNVDPAGTSVRGAALERMQAKAALRTLTAYVNKGVRAVHLYAAKGPRLGLVSPRFFQALRASRGAYPGAGAAGETLRAVGRLDATLTGARRLRRTRRLRLLRVSDRHDRRQFSGDGSAAHPPLYDRDVLAFLPFQLRAGEHRIAVYVMTRDLSRRRRRGGPPARRYDLRPERFRMTIGGLRRAPVRVRATDPLTGARVPVRVRRRGRGRIVVSMRATDYPRILFLSQRRRR